MNAEVQSLKNRVSAAEWEVRVQLAALYRLAALHGWDDFLYTHISARVPGPDRHFLLNPFGLWFEEVTASSLVKVDLEGNIIDGRWGINQAGYVIHSALHEAREDAHFIAHFHTDDGMAASAHREGLLPLNQRALAVLPDLAYHDYEGVALNLDERERLVADLGRRNLLLLRNHGTLALGGTAAQAWSRIYQLEKACSAQVRTLAGGREGVLIAPPTAQEEVRRQAAGGFVRSAQERAQRDALIWQAMERKVQRDSPGFDA
ncbi:class II aldolase/adducin family protein [Azohydromonas lata]|uniref:Class II aldolase/adducin family protein n=1 Tax=Azohydromonas lata TaxID=45677 RepID=A0ABU5IG02_9BURK|nr:class II aldolase/adducin family protein [Azohydromonas lata]MDZ5458051.1 class II aldolase/adducin family protein [Azohydromonas lata]